MNLYPFFKRKGYMEKRQERYRIGLIVGNVEDVFSNQVCKGAMDAVEITGDDLFIFPVKYLDRCEIDKKDPKQKYEYQYNVLLSYANSKALDMLLICLSSIGYMSSEERCMEVLNSFDGIPVLLIASDVAGYSCVKYDNVSGFRDGLTYLINERGCNQIGMLAGTRQNSDARERLDVYKEVLKKNGIPIDEKLIVRGELSEKCKESAEILIANNPDLDAIVCANDAMALAVYEVLALSDRKIGKDICVLGFDDIEEAAYMKPPLATVRADASILGYRAVIEAHAILEDCNFSETRKIIVATKFILRESTSGILEQNIASGQENAEDYKKKLQDMIHMNHRMNIVNRDMLMFGNSNVYNYANFLEAFTIANINSCYMYLLSKPSEHHENHTWTLPEAIYLRSYRIGEEVVEIPRSKQRLSIDEIFNNSYLDKERRTYIIIDIYSRELQYGILMCELPYQYFHYLEMVCYQISIAIKIMGLFAVQEKLLVDKEEMVHKLKAENLLLDDISNKDELTGLLNRRGFINSVEKLLAKENNLGAKAVIIYVDLNYLKQINDRYNHEEGDFAIKICALALEETLGESGMIGRIGGDEFVGAKLVSDYGEGENIKRQVKINLQKFSDRMNKPYEVTASVGVYAFEVKEGLLLNSLMEQADDLLYEDKKRKGPFVETGRNGE